MSIEFNRYAGLIGQVGRGDQDALEALFRETRRPVEAVVRRITCNHEATEEVASDVYLQVWKKAGSFDPDRGDPLSWVLTIARHRAIDHVRSGRRTRVTELPEGRVAEAVKNPGREQSLAETRLLLSAGLRALSSDQKQVIELIYFDGLSHQDAARHLRLPLGTVKTRIRLGLAKLRSFVCPQGTDWTTNAAIA